MKHFLTAMITVAVFASCTQSQGQKTNIPIGIKLSSRDEAVATFSEGCFWHAEIVFKVW